MIRVTTLTIRRSTGYVEKVGLEPAMSEPLDRVHTDTGLVTAYAEWTIEAEPDEQATAWLVHPDGVRERRGVGGRGGHQVLLRIEAGNSGRYVFEVVGADGTVLAAAPLDVDVGF